MDEKIREIEKRWKDKKLIPTWQIGKDIDILLSHISTLEEKVKELESKMGELRMEKQILQGANIEAESRIKEYEEDRHRLACEISKLREQHHDDCKLVIELRDRIKELEERIEHFRSNFI